MDDWSTHCDPRPLELSVPVRCFATAASAEAAAKEFHAHLRHIERPRGGDGGAPCVCPRRVGFDMEWTVTYVRGAPARPTALVRTQPQQGTPSGAPSFELRLTPTLFIGPRVW